LFALSQFILLLSNLYFLFKSSFIPSKLYINWFFLKKSIHQLIYNLSFYGIWLITRSYFSKYLTIEDYSEFSFISSVVEALFLSTGAVTFLMLPKLLNKISNLKEYQPLLEMNKVYNSTNSLLCVFGLLLIPFFNFLFPEYSQADKYFCALLLAQFFLNSPFAFNTLFINKGNENVLTIIGMVVIAFFILAAYFLLINVSALEPGYLLVIAVFTCFLYSSLVKIIALKTYRISKLNFNFLINEVFMLQHISTITFMLILSLLDSFNFYFVPVLVLFHLFFNHKNISEIIKYIQKLLNNPKLLTLKIEK
tara:strand:- start:9021 stop:9944 length:924 start_codon:yes stop_codon:yes gene_type:complete